MPNSRPTPENLLKRAHAEEEEAKRGKLKIYLGASPGVGKTHAMLEDAITLRARGTDVITGIVESHGRSEINLLAEKLETLPRRAVQYQGKDFFEFDLDAALKRHPAIILMDEMAHTNLPGSRHTKRWQDIQELLDQGIDVFSTLNVMHIESLNDIASQIIHSRIRETVPDSMLETAHTIELVDLPPDDLLKRLQEGKVYFPAQAELAKDYFFRRGNLIALRELALRVTAEHVDSEVLLYRQGLGIRHIWRSHEKLMVCITHHPSSLQLIRTAKRMATPLNADWIVVYVDTPHTSISEENRNAAIRNLHMAERLGAQTRILTGTNIVTELINFAHEANVTQIIIHKRVRPRWKEFFRHSLADEIIRKSGEIDVYIVTGGIENPTLLHHPKKEPSPHFSWKTWGIAIAVVTFLTGFNFLLKDSLHPSNLIMIYLLGVTGVALTGKTGPALFASIASVMAFDIFFVPHTQYHSTGNLQYGITILIMLLVTQVIIWLVLSGRKQAESARIAEKRTALQHALSSRLASVRGTDKLLAISARHLAETFASDVLILLADHEQLHIRTMHPANQLFAEKEKGIAQWVLDLGQMAGPGTDTLSFSDSLFVPLTGSRGTIGVIRLHPHTAGRLFSPEELRFITSCATQIAIAIESNQLAEKERAADPQPIIGQAKHALLQSVSHDLRAPLVTIMSAASMQAEMAKDLDVKTIQKMGESIYAEAEQLNRLLHNLLQITWLESESIQLKKIPHNLEDVIHLAIKTSVSRADKRRIQLAIPDNLPLIPFDEKLIREVFSNLIDNAIKFTPIESPIDIVARLSGNEVIIRVEDRGPGIMPDEVNLLFEKFYRGRNLTTERGSGLGLAICREIIKAHGGKLLADNREGGGAIFQFTLPVN